MRLLVLAAAVSAALTGPALAADQLSDPAFIKASRCLGLAQSKALGEIDTTALEALVKAQARNRPPAIADRAADSKAEAQREARRVQGKRRDALIAEWEGPCKRVTGV